MPDYDPEQKQAFLESAIALLEAGPNPEKGDWQAIARGL